MPDTLAGFKQVAETSPANSIIVWLNEYFGEIERYGKRFEDLQVAQQFASRLAGAVGSGSGIGTRLATMSR